MFKLIGLLCIASVVFGRKVMEAGVATMQCETGMTIRVVEATYGENCIGHQLNTVEKDNAKANVQSQCNGKETCSFTVDDSTFGDVAPGCGPKSFDYFYYCKDGDWAVAMEFPGYAAPGVTIGPNDVGRHNFNALFLQTGIIRKDCQSGCEGSWQKIYYARTDEKSAWTGVDAWTLMRQWVGDNSMDGQQRTLIEAGPNGFNVDFIMTGSEDKALAGTQDWTYCNFHHTVGCCRDCGPTAYKAGQWSSSTSETRPSRYSILLADPCENVVCDQGNKCQVGRCDNGNCIYDAIDVETECDDKDSCTVDTCEPDTGCVSTAKVCGDKDVCNGDESCDQKTGECVKGNDLQCERDFICENSKGGCVRDCDTFAIDGYLRDCSLEFGSNENQLDKITDDIELIQNNILIERGRIDDNEADIASNEAGVNDIYERIYGDNPDREIELSIYEEINSLKQTSTAVNQRLVELEEGVKAFGPDRDLNPSDREARDQNVESSQNVGYYTDGYGYNVRTTEPDGFFTILWYKYTEEIMFTMVIMNIILIVSLVCMCYSSSKKVRYETVSIYSSDDRSDAPLNNK